MKYNLVDTHTDDNLILSGLFSKVIGSETAILHIHGYEGNFFTYKFPNKIAEKAYERKISFLSVQHRGSGSEMEFFTYPYGEGGKVIGSHYELIEEAYLDIDAWIKFLLDNGVKNIILEGHSLGTMKAVRYIYEGHHKENIKKLILLCPFDKNAEIQKVYTQNEISKELPFQNFVEILKSEVEKGNGNSLSNFLLNGAYRTYANLYSWCRQDRLGNMFDFSKENFEYEVLTNVRVPTFVLIGSDDEFLCPDDKSKISEVMQRISNISNFKTNIIQGADHDFIGFDDEVAQKVLEFLTD